MHTDPISDMLTRIRNAQTVKKNTVRIPFSRINGAILIILKENGFIEDVKIDEFVSIEATLSRDEDGRAKIKHIERISKPGRRLYVGKNEIPRVLNDYGIAILSTHKGLMTNKEARKIGIGGEIICEVY
ncbi:MAG: 30S ribosomal protein S8 [Candidatus Jacksonbacteria bacterium RIFOXYA2_FULL_44_7]|uniref:Small ribosomal subunit protein uS8 n=1 Tax=Candidatus Jacksonbacteria bacterium RIFCSPLOWO2_02_FULL_44_20 TaxID=1798460 RepID=A0A1G2ACA3_9BACT|nr:MAG: 30S ribosomal protein S8 [Parcubacteria group bacterium GW2011_GWC2_44_17]KKT49949.1 MAG: 30S ribosomal protein S8 [Parcubacteria group bacterium GW2011_GWF2_44_17]OGY70455.1 MAG: 30S ribosomal protein S8 [Candidatus Jacksonbacteria bacterium RIFCSPHIGHO2_12_FULL_44_12]OGY71553.1 MAG: 30S ribosomal protein S8 [Candidatus Jacksonbacteria bacterium RIFCSPHIGHO2_02_FULL_44_25]OGY73670.1 MAG: 30S ribosomal protein S8 [Candidatus Jacksonbacteria bacterium RIFCSPLOWO2_02_FULL_44_20]OGY74574.